MTGSTPHLEIVVVENKPKALIKSLAIRLPICLILIYAGEQVIAVTTSSMPRYDTEIRSVLTIGLAIVISAILAKPFLKKS